MPPSDYIHTRELSQQPTNSTEQYFSKVVDSHPYFPNLIVTASDVTSVKHAALVLVYSSFLLGLCNNNDTNTNNNDSYDQHIKNKLNEFFDSKGLPESSSSSSVVAIMNQLSCNKVTGGITNALFRVSGFQSVLPLLVDDTTNNNANAAARLLDFDSVLVRIFGAEGMIDRDIETSTYAALCNADIAYRYMGRFANGRIEGWLDGYHPLQSHDLVNDENVSLEIAKEMARLHCLFQVPEGELRDHHCGPSSSDLDVISVGLWDQLSSWMEQAKGYTEFKTVEDTERVRLLQLDKIEMEVKTIIQSFTSQGEQVEGEGNDSGDSTASICGSSSNKQFNVVFCHNDLLPANIMRNKATGHIQLIDFEYGGSNYAAFDMANHFNEYAGGTTAKENGVPDYTRFPNPERQTKFCVEYVKMTKRLESMRSDITDRADYDAAVGGNNNGNNDQKEEMVIEEDEGIMNEALQLLSHVQKFILVNHLYWGLWAVNQAAEEGCEEFDYLTFASNRFNEYYVKKSEREKK